MKELLEKAKKGAKKSFEEIVSKIYKNLYVILRLDWTSKTPKMSFWRALQLLWLNMLKIQIE